jgi:hypothetical protein
MIKVIFERNLYSALDDDDFDVVVRKGDGLGEPYTNDLPFLTNVYVFDGLWGKYVMLAMFSKKPTEEKLEDLSDLCSELMTYEHKITSCDNFTEKVCWFDPETGEGVVL